ncbi:hypothetical protein C2I36_04915 [Rhodobacteraceae bacterium WD3A24]|nr:hypothetical protein C2I36_04915 [Rhodobacteraceae bacterium WD3A24]
MAREAGWSEDPRLAFSLFALARLAQPGEGAQGLAMLAQAGAIYRGQPDAALHAAHVEMHLAAHALALGRLETAGRLAARNLDIAARTESAGLLASLMMIRAEVLERTGRPAEARAVRLDSLGWARYALGSDRAARERLAEIAALAPPLQRAEAE